ncbi:MAG: DUF898 family protein [Pseudomonadota bacterium]
MEEYLKAPLSAPPKTEIHGHYTGEAGPLFKLTAITSLLTLFTLGFYRFWGRTRIRRYIWSSSTLQGDAFQYTGNGLEKLLGFLVAVIILAFALGAIQIGLFFFNLSFFSPTESNFDFELQLLAAQASLIFLAPLFFLARYRSMRYKLSRTRWRGVRFGMENAGWAYAWRGLGLTLLTFLTLGLMLPYQTFKLTKFRTDRTWFGNAQMGLDGRWTSLYGSMRHLFFGAILLVGGSVVAGFVGYGSGVLVPIIGAIVGYVWLVVGFIYYRVDTFRRLTGMTTLDEDVGFAAQLNAGSVVWQILGGGFVVSLIYGAILGAVTWILIGNFDPAEATGEFQFLLVALNTLAVLVALLLTSAVSMVMIVQPIIRQVVNGITVTNPEALNRIRQRAEDEQVDADGLADALDFGGAI